MAETQSHFINVGDRHFLVVLIGVSYWRHRPGVPAVELDEWHYRIRECSARRVGYGTRAGVAYRVPARVYAPSPFLPPAQISYAPQIALYLAGEAIGSMLVHEAEAL